MEAADMVNASGGMVWVWPVLGVLVLLLLVLIPLAFSIGRKKGAGGNATVMAAGQWALSRAREVANEVAAADPKTASATDINRRLDLWLAHSLKQSPSTAENLNAEMQADLELAKDFQLAYLNRPYPKIPETHFEGRLRLEFYHRYEPALALGGDFFDLIPLAPDTSGVFVADVMGHGARSALITAILRTMLRDLKNQGRNAKHYITQVNKELCEIMRMFPQPLFASAFYFVPDVTSRMATFTTAGHPAPFHLKRSVGRVTRLDVPSPHGAALGIIPNEEFLAGHVRLLAGDCFFFFTDGVYEAANINGEEFGLSRMEKIIREYMYKSAQIIVDELMKAVIAFMGDAPVNDDICIVAVDITTNAEAPAEKSSDQVVAKPV